MGGHEIGEASDGDTAETRRERERRGGWGVGLERWGELEMWGRLTGNEILGFREGEQGVGAEGGNTRRR